MWFLLLNQFLFYIFLLVSNLFQVLFYIISLSIQKKIIKSNECMQNLTNATVQLTHPLAVFVLKPHSVSADTITKLFIQRLAPTDRKPSQILAFDVWQTTAWMVYRTSLLVFHSKNKLKPGVAQQQNTLPFPCFLSEMKLLEVWLS